MIISSNKNYKSTYLFVSEISSGFKIQLGKVSQPSDFIQDQSILISADKPNLFWDILHELIGIPYPQLQPLTKIEDPIESRKEKPVEKFNNVIMNNLELNTPEIIPEKLPLEEKIVSNSIVNPLENQFKEMKAKDILEKIKAEKGIDLNISLKSKSAIIRKALKIYQN